METIWSIAIFVFAILISIGWKSIGLFFSRNQKDKPSKNKKEIPSYSLKPLTNIPSKEKSTFSQFIDKTNKYSESISINNRISILITEKKWDDIVKYITGLPLSQHTQEIIKVFDDSVRLTGKYGDGLFLLGRLEKHKNINCSKLVIKILFLEYSQLFKYEGLRKVEKEKIEKKLGLELIGMNLPEVQESSFQLEVPLIDLKEKWINGEITYYELLDRMEWKEKRNEILIRDNYTCQQCNSKNSKGNPLQIHHKRYILKSFPWDYVQNDLITYCRSCHKKWHLENKVKYYEYINGNLFESTIMPCSRCDGSGYLSEYSYYQNGVCFSCGGIGYHKPLESNLRINN
jgi:hypothetical protein